MPKTILVSACLLGINCRYNGKTKTVPAVVDIFTNPNVTAIPVCPEQLGGLPTPRPKVSFAIEPGTDQLPHSSKPITESGEDMTDPFIKGAEQTLAIAKVSKATTAIMKERSPSCGCKKVYYGDKLVEGSGITAALLQKNGLDLFSEEDIIEGNFSLQTSTNIYKHLNRHIVDSA